MESLDQIARNQAYNRKKLDEYDGVYRISEEPAQFYKRLDEIFHRYRYGFNQVEEIREIYEYLREREFYHPKTIFGVYETEEKEKYSIHCLMPELEINMIKAMKSKDSKSKKVYDCMDVLKDYGKDIFPDITNDNWGFDDSEIYFIDLEIISTGNGLRGKDRIMLIEDLLRDH